MKSPVSQNLQPIRVAVALGILILFTPPVTVAEGSQVEGKWRHARQSSTTAAVPKGITSSDWMGIRAAHDTLEGARLEGEEHGTPQPIMMNSVAQQAYLKASNTDAFDGFGATVAISGNTVVITAVGEGSSAAGINGDQTDNSEFLAGAVYVFVRHGDTWTQQAYLKASNPDGGDRFGFSVAISGDTLVVGADSEESNATRVNGNQTDNSAPGSGAAYIFVRNGETWTQQAYLKASNAGAGDAFGHAVAISGDTLIVGAIGESSNATGINGDQMDNSASETGAGYVFTRTGTVWTQQAYLKGSNTRNADLFGNAVAISGDTIIVGAPGERSSATGINGNEADTSAYQSGAAYIFVRHGNTWSQQSYAKASNTNTGDYFGTAVALAENTAIVGAQAEDGGAVGINGDQADDGASGAGAAYVFVRNGTVWSQQAYLKASNAGAGDNFGHAVAISGDTLIVGAIGESSNATGIDNDQTDDSVSEAGAAYVFVRQGETWTQQTYLKASNTESTDFFGYGVAISGNTALVGANQEDSSAAGINGNQADNSMSTAGSAYVFTGLGLDVLLNISTRANVGTGDAALIGGFIITGMEPKKVMVRAIGPSLVDFGVAGALANPVLELHGPGNSIVTNDDWKDTQEREIAATEIPPTNDLESAIVATLQAGAYTAIVRGSDESSGVGLVEAYDLNQAVPSQLANISTRGLVAAGENVLIGGFILGNGVGSADVIVRGIGPSLGEAGVGNPLSDPILELRDGNGVITATNDNWMDNPDKQAISDSGLDPTNDKESALLAHLAPGAYTAILRGVNGSRGVALIEVYRLR